jgi:hypothetical protein
MGCTEERMNTETWKRTKLAELRAQIKIEEAILRSLRCELEEIQWLTKRDAELQGEWEATLTAEEQHLRQCEEQFAEIWLAGEHNLK